MIRVLLCLLALLSPAFADPVEDFYKGSDITILIGHPPGGSYDIYAQLAARHLGKYIPGHPNLIVQSMPGGAASKATAYFYHRAPQDGSMIALFPETIAYVQLLDPVQGKWDVRKMHYIGSFAPVNTVFMGHRGGTITTIDDLLTKPANIGCTGRASQSFQYPSMLKATEGLKLSIICGYDGSSAYTLALLRGEVDVVSKSWNSWRAEDRDNLDSGVLIPLMQAGLARAPELAEVKLMQQTTDDPRAQAALRFISAGAAIGRALVAPPGIPADRLAALRAAFDAAIKDPALIDEAAHGHVYLDPHSGVATQAVSDAIIATPPDMVAVAEKAFQAE